MIFVGAQSINSRAILANKKKYICMIFVGGGGGTCPPGPPPHSYAPV